MPSLHRLAGLARDYLFDAPGFRALAHVEFVVFSAEVTLGRGNDGAVALRPTRFHAGSRSFNVVSAAVRLFRGTVRVRRGIGRIGGCGGLLVVTGDTIASRRSRRGIGFLGGGRVVVTGSTPTGFLTAREGLSIVLSIDYEPLRKGSLGAEGEDALGDENDECNESDGKGADDQRPSRDSRSRLGHHRRRGGGEATSGPRRQQVLLY